MFRHQPTQGQKKPVINLSSDQDSDSDSEKENQHMKSTSTYVPSNTISQVNRLVENQVSYKQPLANAKTNINAYKPNNFNSGKSKTNNACQFSTLSLDEPSGMEYLQQQMKTMLLQKDNQELTKINQSLIRQMEGLKKGGKWEREKEEYQNMIQQTTRDYDQIRDKYKRLQTEYGNYRKQMQNRMLGQMLPCKKKQQQAQKHITVTFQKIKTIITKHLQQLSQQKMNAKVENIITNLVNELTEITTSNQINNSSLSEFSSVKQKSIMNLTPSPYRSQRSNNLMRGTQYNKIELDNSSLNNKLNISQDYQLLSKSIDKLKAMERHIDQSAGSYLTKQSQIDKEPPSISNAVGLDQSSISVLDRSKSKRKKIFQ